MLRRGIEHERRDGVDQGVPRPQHPCLPTMRCWPPARLNRQRMTCGLNSTPLCCACECKKEEDERRRGGDVRERTPLILHPTSFLSLVRPSHSRSPSPRAFPHPNDWLLQSLGFALRRRTASSGGFAMVKGEIKFKGEAVVGSSGLRDSFEADPRVGCAYRRRR